jgi:hypothetical protein
MKGTTVAGRVSERPDRRLVGAPTRRRRDERSPSCPPLAKRVKCPGRVHAHRRRGRSSHDIGPRSRRLASSVRVRSGLVHRRDPRGGIFQSLPLTPQVAPINDSGRDGCPGRVVPDSSRPPGGAIGQRGGETGPPPPSIDKYDDCSVGCTPFKRKTPSAVRPVTTYRGWRQTSPPRANRLMRRTGCARGGSNDRVSIISFIV